MKSKQSLRPAGLKNFATVYIVRHGQTEWNLKKIIQGQSDSPLTDEGVKQARNLSKKLKKIKFDLVFSSDLMRAKKTAEIITAEQKLEIATSKLLRERHFGRLEGKPVQTLRAFDELFTKLKHEEIYSYKSLPDVESDEEIVTRLITFLREAAISHPGKKILVVSHGGIMRAFLIKLGVSDYKNPIFVGNAGYIRLETDGVDFYVKEVEGIERKKYEKLHN